MSASGKDLPLCSKIVTTFGERRCTTMQASILGYLQTSNQSVWVPTSPKSQSPNPDIGLPRISVPTFFCRTHPSNPHLLKVSLPPRNPLCHARSVEGVIDFIPILTESSVELQLPDQPCSRLKPVPLFHGRKAWWRNARGFCVSP